MTLFKKARVLTAFLRHTGYIGAAVCIIIFSVSSASAQLTPNDTMQFNEKISSFDEGWQIRWGDSPIDSDGIPAWIKSDEGWSQPDNLSNPHGREAIHYIWYKNVLKDVKWNDPCIFFPWVYYSCEVYIGNKVIYRHGNKDGTLADYAGFPFHLIPYNNTDAGKTIYVRVYSAGTKRIGLAKGILTGSLHAIHIMILRKDAPRAVISFLMLALALFMVFMFLRSPRDGGLFITFGMFLLSMSIWNLFNSRWRGFIVNAGSADIYLELLALFLAPAALMYYFDRVFEGGYKHILTWTARGFAAFFIAGVIASFAGPLFLYEKFLPLFQTFALPFMVIPFVFVVYRAFARKETEAQILVAGLFSFVIFSVYDLLISFMGWASFMPRLTYFGMLIIIVSQAMIIVRRFNIMTQNLKLYSVELESAKSQLEEYAANLEVKVDDRTKQLQNANTEIAAAMEELEAVNENLTMTNRELEDAKRAADRDMYMAINVQSNFLPKRAPVSEMWEIAYAFKPMSGVSGDLYDFYLDDKGLFSGVSLFDVSGHGIASGLITMLAKSIAFRRFTSMRDKRLGIVLEKINEDLITEIGGIDNYLTGVIMRFKDDTVEYVNAGHTDLLLRSASDGKVVPVQPKQREFKGFFLGIEEMAMNFDTVSFRIKQGDCLLLYCDCLIEGSSINGEQFGPERLQQTFSSASEEPNAKSQLNAVLKEFYAFTGDKPLDDDLTAILVRRI